MEALLGLLFLAFIVSMWLGAPEWVSELIWIVFLTIIGIGFLFLILNRFSLFRRVRFSDPELNRCYRWSFPRFWGRSRKYRSTRRPGSFKAGLRVWGLWLLVFALLATTAITMVASFDVEHKWVSMAMLLGTPVIGLGLLFRLFTAGQKARRDVQRLTAPEAENALEQDERSPVLLLRAFRMDEANADPAIPGDIPLTFEEFIVKPLKQYGPVVAIGRPTEELPPLGAHREYVADDWQGRVKELLQLAQTIVVILDNTPGLQWELEQLRDPELMHKLLLVVPTEDLNGLKSLGWSGIDQAIGVIEDGTENKRYILALVFSEDGDPYYITGPRNNAEYYRDAVQLGSRYICDN